MKAIQVLAVVLALACSGCANLTTIGRSTELPHHGIAVHLDAQQRVTVANKRGWVCAEPSPDALQATASSAGLGFSAPSKETISLAMALSANAGSIGLRTQSITLMRDELYRICELYFNGGMTKEQAVQLLERSQDLTLGVLAIEQLTGAVVARQVMLNTSSTANSAGSINDTQKELDKAKADEAAKKSAVDEAQTALDAQKKIAADKTTEATSAKAKAKSTQSAIDQLTPALATAQTTLETAISDRLTLKLQVVGLQTKIAPLEAALKQRKAEAVVLHGKATDAEKAYQTALAAASKEPRPAGEQKALDDLDAASKAAAAAETAANTTVDQTSTALAKAKQDVSDATVKAKAADGPVDVAQSNVDMINAQLKTARDDPNQVAADAAVTAQKTATDTQKKKQAALDDATKALDQAKTNSATIEKLGNSGTASANAAASGTGSFSSATDRYGVSKETIDALTRATTDIVQLVVNKGHLTDSCALILMNYASKPENMDRVIENILPICTEVIAATLAVYRSTAGKPGGVPGAAAPAAPAAAPAAAPLPKL